MNNKNKILVGCLALLLVLSVGYALFSETITINGTATAKGSFDIEATCEKGFNDDLLTGAFGMTQAELGEGGYNSSNETCSVSENTVTLKSELQYPSATRYFTVKFENKGTIDAVIKTVEPIYENANETIKVYNSSTNALEKTLVYGTTEYSAEADEYAKILPIDGIARLVDGTFTTEPAANQMILKDAAGNYYLKLAPGESLYMVFQMSWSSEATTTGKYSETTATYNFDFQQISSDLEVDTDGYTCFGGC